MLRANEFERYHPGRDPWEGIPALRLHDLEPVDLSRPVKVSFLICFTNWRMSQLARTLETLCRQNMKDIEVLICDDGSTQDMEAVYNAFRPYLNMQTFRLERAGFSGCPSRGIKHVLPHAAGEVHVIMQPECMLTEDASEYIYRAHFAPLGELRDSAFHKMKADLDPLTAPRWVCLRTGFFDEFNQEHVDSVDWHSRVRAVQDLPMFWDHEAGLGRMTNRKVLEYDHWPWWFVGSCKAEDPILRDLPVFRGHASIDFWLLGYRSRFGYLDIFPLDLKTFHQWHLSARVAPEGEADSINYDEIERRRNAGLPEH